MTEGEENKIFLKYFKIGRGKLIKKSITQMQAFKKAANRGWEI